MIVRTDRGEFLVQWRHIRKVKFVLDDDAMNDLKHQHQGYPLPPEGTRYPTEAVRRILSRGGRCWCTISRRHATNRILDPIGFAEVECSDDDNYCKETGRRKSLEKALKHLGGFSSPQRRRFLTAYRNRKLDPITMHIPPTKGELRVARREKEE